MTHLATEKKIHYILRLAVAMCFIGHGTFGIITKPIWCNYFAVFGIGQTLAYKLMPVLGTFDILAGIAMLLYPLRIIPAWLVVWGIVTALLRPISHEPFGEFVERAGNYGAPLALLILSGGLKNIHKHLFTKIKPDSEASEETIRELVICLRVVVFMLLAGHAWLNLIEKKGLIGQYTSLGFHDPSAVARYAGIFELISAIVILIRPLKPIVLTLFIWKMGTELFYPHYEIFEWIERGGSYGCLLALWFALDLKAIRKHQNNWKISRTENKLAGT